MAKAVSVVIKIRKMVQFNFKLDFNQSANKVRK